MPKTEPLVVTYTGSVTPKKTAFLESAEIAMDFTATIDLEGSDIANAKTVQKEFQSAMKRQLETQLAALNTWLAEKDKMLATLMKEFDALKKGGFPKTEQEAKARAALIKSLEPTLLKVNKLETEWREIVTAWAENAREQQGLVSMKIAVKAARVKTFQDKTWRVRTGQAIKVGLVVAAVVLSAVAIALTMGAATPLVLGIAIASASLAGLASIGEVGLMISKNLTIEKKLMANLTGDVDKVRQALDTAAQAGGALAKHVTEMQNLIKLRADSIKDLETALQKAEAPAKRLAADLSNLKDDSLEAGDIAKRRSEAEKLTQEIDETKAKIAKLEQDNAQSEALLADLETMVGDLGVLSTRSANSMAGNLKKKLTSVEGVMEVGKQVMGLGQAASKFGSLMHG